MDFLTIALALLGVLILVVVFSHKPKKAETAGSTVVETPAQESTVVAVAEPAKEVISETTKPAKKPRVAKPAVAKKAPTKATAKKPAAKKAPVKATAKKPAVKAKKTATK